MLSQAAIGAFALSLAAACPGLGAEPRLWTNCAALKELPQGPGLAATFPKETPLRANPGIILADDFESGDLGQG